jgi:predicted amidophosphoribosyltransferase
MPLMTPAEILDGAGPIRQPAAALVAQWVAAIPSVGFGQPVVIGRDGRVIGGLARVLAAQELGLARVPVVRLGAPRGPKRNASRARPVGFDPKAGGLGVLGSLVWRPAVYSRHEVAWVSARAWRDTSKAEDLAALKAAKAARDPAVLEAAAAELATVLRRLRGDWSDHAVTPVPCGHSGTGDCFGKRLAQQVAETLGTEFVELWADRPLAGVSHPARNARLPELVWAAEPAGPILIVDDVASTGAHLEQALMAVRGAGQPAMGAAWISGDVR